ncbi:hypothetical protein ACQUZE_08830, partial [Streptococcus pyogenes]|uniref:hypothetical protein n=1 Tax=Streptococcus pyogenes TaxID=1314 RepID=UPI003D9FBCF3
MENYNGISTKAYRGPLSATITPVFQWYVVLANTLRNRHLTSPQLAASVNSTRKTPVSTSTVKRRLRDAGLLGR